MLELKFLFPSFQGPKTKLNNCIKLDALSLKY